MANYYYEIYVPENNPNIKRTLDRYIAENNFKILTLVKDRTKPEEQISFCMPGMNSLDKLRGIMLKISPEIKCFPTADTYLQKFGRYQGDLIN